MRRPTKFVQDLTGEQKSGLQTIMKSDAPQRKRMRAHAILLSSRSFSIDQIATIYEVDRDRVSIWLEWWLAAEFDGLEDEPRTGRPPKLSRKNRLRSWKSSKLSPAARAGRLVSFSSGEKKSQCPDGEATAACPPIKIQACAAKLTASAQ